jgi:hypothetical protein
VATACVKSYPCDYSFALFFIRGKKNHLAQLVFCVYETHLLKSVLVKAQARTAIGHPQTSTPKMKQAVNPQTEAMQVGQVMIGFIHHCGK